MVDLNKIYLLILLTLLCSSLVFSQKTDAVLSVISGKVELEGEYVIGATLAIKALNQYQVTDLSGSYKFKDIPFGEYQIEISFIGAETLIQNIQVNKSKTKLDITLKPSATELTTATVAAKSFTQQQRDRPIQIESVAISTVSGRVKDLTEAIEQLPGINIRGSGSFGEAADITINGLNGTAVRAYIDGLPLAFIFPSFSINNIPIDNISRVDVYKGVVPINIGTDALGGGINIITQQKPYNEIKASYSLGSFNTHQANITGTYKIAENTTIGANVTYNYSDNDYTMDAFVWEEQEVQEITRFHDAYELFFAEVALDIRNKSWADKFGIFINYGTSYKEVQNGGQIRQLAFGDVNYDGTATSLSVIYNKSFGKKVHLETSTNYNFNNIIFTDSTANFYSWSGEVIDVRPSQRGELGGNSISDRDFYNTVNRINLRYQISPNDELLLSNLIAHQNTVGSDEMEDPERDFLRNNQYLTKNILGLQFQKKLFDQKLTAAIAGKLYYFNVKGVERLNFNEVTSDGKELGYYLSAKYNFTDRLFIRGSYESALRIPTFAQFFGNGGNIISNVELTTESSDNYNLGFSYRTPSDQMIAFSLGANGFLRGQNNLIYLTTDVFQRYRNAEEVRTIGMEGNVTLTFWKKLSLQYNITRLKQTYESINPNNPSAQFLIGTPFPNNPNFFMNARLTYDFENLNLFRKTDLSLYTQYKYVDQFNFINVGQIFDPANYVPAQHRFDMGLVMYCWGGKISLALNANNIFDADIFDNFSIPRPGRNYNFKLTYRFNDF